MTQMAGERLFELFDIALDTTSSPRTVPSRGDLEGDDILNSPGYKHLLEKGLIPPPVKKADASLGGALAGTAFGSPITASGGLKDLEVEGFDSMPEHLRNKLREMEWKKQYELDQQLGLEPRF
jgi:hypothetical protein